MPAERMFSFWVGKLFRLRSRPLILPCPSLPLLSSSSLSFPVSYLSTHLPAPHPPARLFFLCCVWLFDPDLIKPSPLFTLLLPLPALSTVTTAACCFSMSTENDTDAARLRRHHTKAGRCTSDWRKVKPHQPPTLLYSLNINKDILSSLRWTPDGVLELHL